MCGNSLKKPNYAKIMIFNRIIMILPTIAHLKFQEDEMWVWYYQSVFINNEKVKVSSVPLTHQFKQTRLGWPKILKYLRNLILK